MEAASCCRGGRARARADAVMSENGCVGLARLPGWEGCCGLYGLVAGCGRTACAASAGGFIRR